MQEENPLKWPDGWPRTRLQDRQPKPAWKKTYSQSVQALEQELKRLGATTSLITRNSGTNEDSGVAVYFSLSAIDNYGWQEALGFVGMVPTLDQIDKAYREKVKPYHPEGSSPDIEMFRTLTTHRDRARAWARGEQTVERDKVIPCDAFKEPRWNINAIAAGINRGTVPQVIYKLNKAGLINKNGGRFALKNL